VKIYYEDGRKPDDPTPAELSALQALNSDAANFLERVFPGNKKLQALAIRDRDGDGITDFRISECGLFRENDPDVDCDGIANVLDDQPYGSVANPHPSSCALEPDWRKISNDHNQNGLPDQIEWHSDASNADESRAAKVQADLYRDFGIVLVNRAAQMPADLALQIDRVIREIFRGRIAPDFAPLRVIAADSRVCPDTADYYGWSSPENSTVSLMDDTMALSPILRLEILVHEITHTIQYAMDFAPADLAGYRKENRWKSEGFRAFARSLEWGAEPNPSKDSGPDLRPVINHCKAIDPVTLSYQGDEFPDKDGLMYAGWRYNDLQYLWIKRDETERAARHMASQYALMSDFEWDSEYRAAFVLNKLFDAAGRLCDQNEAQDIRAAFQNDIIKNEWNITIENARGLASYETVIAQQFSVADDTWDALAREFLLGSYGATCRE
jgi:hypothetical protein